MSTLEDSCGPAGCPIDSLISDTVEFDDADTAFTELAAEKGWTDGLPVLTPTPPAVKEFVEASGWMPHRTLGTLPPLNIECTVENAAVNAVMAGAKPEMMPLICSAVSLLADMDLYGPVTTTNAAAEALIVNGDARQRFSIPSGPGCLGGAVTPATAASRALRLIMRNVGGEILGEGSVTSKSTFGQPARHSGILFAEWEEASPWAPLAERNGVAGDAISGFVTAGTEDIVDVLAADGETLAAMIGRSLAYPAQATIVSKFGGDILLCVCPPWARMLAATFGDVEDVQERLFREAVVPRRMFPDVYQDFLDQRNLFDAHGDVLVVNEPASIHVVVCGGESSLHATAMRGFPHPFVSRPIGYSPALTAEAAS